MIPGMRAKSCFTHGQNSKLSLGRERHDKSHNHEADLRFLPVWHPRRRSLEDVELLDLGGDPRHDLDGRGPRADDGHPLALDLDALVPVRTVELHALELFTALRKSKKNNP